MFTRITGSVVSLTEQAVVIETGGLGYEIILAPCIAEPLRREQPKQLTLEIYSSLAIDGNSARFTYFGFTNVIEREFFEALIRVAGIGPRLAARAFSKPMAQIAKAIDTSDLSFLMTLPGIGRQKAREIVAKLQGKVSRFLLIPEHMQQAKLPVPEYTEEALAVLLQLGYKVPEAELLIQETLAAEPSIADTEELLAKIYRRRTGVLAV